MKLFALRDVNYKLVKDDNNQVVYFSSKEAARQYRSTLTTDENTYFVTLGSDHKLYKGEK
jgi:hypothetical protein